MPSINQDTVVSTEASLNHSAPVINLIDIARLEAEELNPDEPEEILQKELLTETQQEDTDCHVGPKVDAKNLTVKENAGTEVERERTVPAAETKEPVRRICRRVKMVEKEKGKYCIPDDTYVLNGKLSHYSNSRQVSELLK